MYVCEDGHACVFGPMPIMSPVVTHEAYPSICMYIHIDRSKDACVYVCIYVCGPVLYMTAAVVKLTPKSARAILPGCECCYAQWPV